MFHFFKLAVICIGLLLPSTSFAAVKYWYGRVDDDFFKGANWMNGVAPATGDTLYLGYDYQLPFISVAFASTKACTIDSTAPTFSSIILGNDFEMNIGSSGVLNLTGSYFDPNLGHYSLGLVGGKMDNSGTLTFTNTHNAIHIFSTGYVYNVGGSNDDGAIWTLLENDGTLHINGDAEDGILAEPNGGVVRGSGTFLIQSCAGNGIHLDPFNRFLLKQGGSLVINDPGNTYVTIKGDLQNEGTMDFAPSQVMNVMQAGISIDSGGFGYNQGTISIAQMLGGPALRVGGIFDNGRNGPPSQDGLIYLGASSSYVGPLVQAISSARLRNNACSVLNLTTAHPIEVSSSPANFLNRALITSVYSGPQTNLGTFTNDSEIRTPTATFTLTPGSNPLIGTGSITNTVTGPIPANSCLSMPNAVPTMSQWGLIILCLLILCVGGIAVFHRLGKGSGLSPRSSDS